MLGTLLVGVFCASELGAFSGYGFGGDNSSIGEQMYAQLVGIGSTVLYTAIVSWIILKVVDLTLGLRVDEEDEHMGLDIALHEEKGYDL
jgi:Amt family ammonium transporter